MAVKPDQAGRTRTCRPDTETPVAVRRFQVPWWSRFCQLRAGVRQPPEELLHTPEEDRHRRGIESRPGERTLPFATAMASSSFRGLTPPARQGQAADVISPGSAGTEPGGGARKW